MSKRLQAIWDLDLTKIIGMKCPVCQKIYPKMIEYEVCPDCRGKAEKESFLFT